MACVVCIGDWELEQEFMAAGPSFLLHDVVADFQCRRAGSSGLFLSYRCVFHATGKGREVGNMIYIKKKKLCKRKRYFKMMKLKNTII